MERRIWGILTALILILGLLFLFQPKGPRHKDSILSIAPQTHPRRPSSRSPRVSEKAPPLEQDDPGLTQCPAARNTYLAAVDTLRSDCEHDFRARSCDPPIEWPEGAMSLADTTNHIRTTIQRNCPDLGTKVAMDCSAYPCSVISETSSEEGVYSCLDVSPEATPDPEVSLVNEGLSVIALVVTDGRPGPKTQAQFLQAATRRLRANTASIKQKLGQQTLPVISGVQDLASCPESEEEPIPVPTSCEELAVLEGCEFRPDEYLRPEDYEAYLSDVDAALDELQRTCPTLDQLHWELDCDEVPCVLVFSAIPKNWVRLMCVPDFLDGVRVTGLEGHSRLLPLYHLGDPDTQESLRNRWKRRSSHRFNTLSRGVDEE